MAAHPAAAGIVTRSWLGANRYLIARRAVQLGILALFLLGPLAGVWIVKGNLSSSLTLGVLPLTDPFVLAQTMAAGHWPEATALAGAGIIAAFYFLVSGRSYCAWVCPVNVVTDAAAWLRDRLGIPQGRTPRKGLRFWLLGAVLLVAAATGTAAWEFVNPVSMTHRAIIFGAGLAWLVVAAVFLFDLVVARRGWCSHVCPMGAFYSLLGRGSPLKVSAAKREACDDCGDCFRVCPEPEVIAPALKPKRGEGPVIASSQCTNCGRCLDVCTRDVFRFTIRIHPRSAP